MAVYLIPCPIAENTIQDIPDHTVSILHQLDHFVVEKAKTARHFIKEAKHPVAIQDLIIEEMFPSDDSWKKSVREWLQKGISFGVISEAGCPGIADPGAEVAALAHSKGIDVLPLTGPSSIFLALMASGFNGQSFSFHGYLSNKKPELAAALKKLEKNALNGSSQIFMEAPYRNKFILENMFQVLQENTLLCVACDIHGIHQSIKTQSIKKWKNTSMEFYHKKPCIYVLGKPA